MMIIYAGFLMLHTENPKQLPYMLQNLPIRRSSPRSQVFTIWKDPKPVNNLFIFFQALKGKKTQGKKLTQALL